jgi:hypothetical protein
MVMRSFVPWVDSENPAEVRHLINLAAVDWSPRELRACGNIRLPG